MTINFRESRKHLEAFDFKRLFTEELGWGRSSGRPVPVEVDGARYRLAPIAELGGMVVYQCESQAAERGAMPPANIRKKIDKRVADLAFEHILIFVDAARTQAVWQWVKRGAGQSAKARQHTYTRGQPGDSLLQKLVGIAFDIDQLDEEGKVAISVVTGKVAKAFDVDRVTRRFYTEFKSQHDALTKFVKGVDAATERAWYALVMLNRLMFIYFIQKKGFLDGDEDYLRHRLEASKKDGRDQYYRHFLIRLFFEGFALEEAERPPEVRKLLGRIPYLNGGLFLPHPIEKQHGLPLSPTLPPSQQAATGEGSIQIPDSVFERLFAFFDQYAWYLDDRPLRADNEINPDVLGYIFEQYVNQKQMGAYYTKEDITGYICRNTILPFLFDKLATFRYNVVHPLPLKDVEPYIYPAVKQAEYLPTETEREYAARQKRLAQIRALTPTPASPVATPGGPPPLRGSGGHGQSATGEGLSINDLITYNLDIERFVQDWLRGLDDPLTLRAFYFECLKKLTVLDPTVGSGAFLFAAMNIVEPLYELCLDKMAHWAGPKHAYADFKEELARVAEHPNRRYFVFKSIIVNNLYGVDIMEEATEICKLRLFLKLVAQVEDVNHIEPLPDIDFNIRAGNTLVGYASLEEVERAAQRSLFNVNLPQRIKEADVALRAFRELQTQRGISARVLAKAKTDTQKKLGEIETELNEALRSEYGARKLETFVESHRPFHWYVEFNRIMQDGGFDVIVGNPPYVEYSKVKQDYTVRGYETEKCGNLFALVMERSVGILHSNGRLGLIVPVSFASSGAFDRIRDVMWNCNRVLWLSHFANRPGQLFSGAQNRLTIVLTGSAGAISAAFSTRYHRWDARNGERDTLFYLLEYVPLGDLARRFQGLFPKVGTKEVAGVMSSMLKQPELGKHLIKSGKHRVYWVRVPGYFCQFFLDPPKARSENGGPERIRGEVISIALDNESLRRTSHAILNSSTYYQFYCAYTDGRHINPSDVSDFPIDLSAISPRIVTSLSELSVELGKCMKSNTTQWRKSGLFIDSVDSKPAKPIIDKIDRVLARHYGFTNEELDFIINYDIKYRMGKDNKEE